MSDAPIRTSEIPAQAAEIIDRLGLSPLPVEGGWFRRVFTHAEKVSPGGRPLTSTIHYLLTRENFSHLHRVDAVEQFFHVSGGPARLHLLEDNGYRSIRLGDVSQDPDAMVSAVVPKDCWQALTLEPGGSFALFAVTVTPAYEDAGFEIARSDHLADLPQGLGDQLRPLLAPESGGST